MLTVVTFLWKPAPGYRSKFTTAHVDVLRRMVARHYNQPHRFVLVTDDAAGLTEPDIECVQLWSDYRALLNPSGRNNPSCYRRLRVFAPKPGNFLGERFVCMDLDTVITGDLSPLWDRQEDFVIWRSVTSSNPYNGSMFMLKAGARPKVWMDFQAERSAWATRRAGLYGSDQAWIAHCLGPHEATWTAKDGVLSWRMDVQSRPGAALPPEARVVFFHGADDPWLPAVQKRAPWIRKHWR